ncbi:hypothetical protein SUDANB176_06868 [Streptomyces sp. enrichment culture]
MPGRQGMPSTPERSSKDAQRTWIKAHDSAVRADLTWAVTGSSTGMRRVGN